MPPPEIGLRGKPSQGSGVRVGLIGFVGGLNLLNFVKAVDFRRIDRSHSKLKTGMQPAVDFLRRWFRGKQPPGAIDHSRTLRAVGCDFQSFHI